MRYVKFTISNYRGIEGPLEINILKNSLIPIIGVNECGKTTILQALLAFDIYNDDMNYGGRHLKDIDNLYASAPKPAEIAAEIEIGKPEIKKALKRLLRLDKWKQSGSLKKYIYSRAPYVGSITIIRNLRTRKYAIHGISTFKDNELNEALSEEIIRKLPFILYFDDFQGSVPDRIEIQQKNSDESEWLAIFETLFKKTDPEFSIYNLPSKEERQRKSMLSKVKRKLNESLTNEWKNFRLDDSDALQISIEYEESNKNDAKRSYLKFDIVETDASGNEHYFFIRDRSKGFYWFFNFVMKLEFNPKVVANSDVDAIYILDEPGSYLHSLAQERLCKKLRQLSQNNCVIYCTHSHYLLNPEVIPLNSVKIAEKDRHGRISLVSIYDHHGSILDNRAAYQPLLDALQVRPFAVDIARDLIIITEGMIDYYLLEIFKNNLNYRVLPSVGETSIKYYISIMIAWRVPYKALWDNDDEGRQAFDDANNFFGEGGGDHLHLIPIANSRTKKRVIQDLIEGDDVKNIRTMLGLPNNTSIGKTISALFYSQEKDQIVDRFSEKTINNFNHLIASLGIS